MALQPVLAGVRRWLTEGEGPEDAVSLLSFAVLPILKIFVMAGLGYLIALPAFGNILDSAARKQLTKLVFMVFLPCLLFTQLGHAVTWENVLQWWFIPINILLSTGINCCLGYLVARFCKVAPEFIGSVAVMVGMGNIGNIPLVIVAAICRDPKNPFGSTETCDSSGVAYIAFGQWVGAILVYTVGYNMLKPPPVQSVEVGSWVVETGDVPLLPDFPDEERDQYDLLESHHSWTRKCWLQVEDYLRPFVKKLRPYTKQLELSFQPPVVASLLALIIGCIPWLKKQIYEEHSPAYFVYDAMVVIGGAMIPCIMMVLGGNLASGVVRSQLGTRTTVVVVLVRLLLVPVIGVGIVLGAEYLGFFPPDRMLKFVLLLQHSTPSSIVAGSVANLIGHAEREISSLLFYEHVFCMISMAGWLMVFISIL